MLLLGWFQYSECSSLVKYKREEQFTDGGETTIMNEHRSVQCPVFSTLFITCL